MRTELFDYQLPPELIAQSPAPRGESRLLILNRKNGSITHRLFSNLNEYLIPGDTLVLNNTRVTARRLTAMRENGKSAEILLLHPVGECAWEVLVKPGKAFREGMTVYIQEPDGRSLSARIVGSTPAGGRIIEMVDRDTRDLMSSWGVTPLPPYIHIPLPAEEESRYQTVYAEQGGSAAAPTAGLHFTEQMIEDIKKQGIDITTVTLSVGVGTFRPVRTETIEEHEMHSESYSLSQETASCINCAKGRIIAVGTTSLRVLESVALSNKQTNDNVPSVKKCKLRAAHGETNLFVTPGYRFQIVDGLLTNFHLPRSTLLMLVSAFAGIEATKAAYAEAIEKRYRFFSFGDAMLIL